MFAYLNKESISRFILLSDSLFHTIGSNRRCRLVSLSFAFPETYLAMRLKCETILSVKAGVKYIATKGGRTLLWPRPF